jgi:hypothetical protein
MQQPLTLVQPSEPENKCPDCIFVKLEGKQIPRRFKLNFRQPERAATQQISLKLLISFNAQWESLKIGRIKFGLKGGELKLRLENCKMYYEDCKLHAPLDISIQQERQEQKSSKSRVGIEPTWSDGQLGGKINFDTENTNGRTDTFKVNAYQVSQKGSEENPTWVFEVETGEPFLKGRLAGTELGLVTVERKPCSIKATFEVSQRDIHIVEAEDPWLINLIPEKRTVLDIIFAKKLLEHKLTPYLSRAELQYV